MEPQGMPLTNGERARREEKSGKVYARFLQNTEKIIQSTPGNLNINAGAASAITLQAINDGQACEIFDELIRIIHQDLLQNYSEKSRKMMLEIAFKPLGDRAEISVSGKVALPPRSRGVERAKINKDYITQGSLFDNDGDS